MASETVHGRPDSPTAPMAAPAETGRETDVASSIDDGVVKERPPVISRKEKLKRHFARFKWWYLLGAVVGLAIILPIIFKVIIPAIIKNVVKNQSLPVNNGTLRFIDPGRLEMSMDTALNTPLAVKIDPLGLELYDPEVDPNSDGTKPFVTLQMPEQHIHHETNVSIASQVLDIQNQTQLTAWANKYFDGDEVELRIKANEMHAHLSSLDYTVQLDKTIKVKGLNYLKGFGVDDVRFIIPPGDDGINMRGRLTIPNSGVITVGLGNVSFNMMAGDINLGLVNVNDLDLKPGNNSYAFFGEFYFNELIPNLAAILDSTKDALNDGGMLALTARGNQTLSKGQHIKYIESVLNAKRIPMTIPAITLLADVVAGVLAGGTDGSQLPLLDTLGQVMGNSTLFENLLTNWDKLAKGEPIGNRTAAAAAKRAVAAQAKRKVSTNLLRLGLRSLVRSKMER